MSTFELWTAIDRGDIAPTTPVWCEGMECWTPVEQLAEFSEASTQPTPSESSKEPRAEEGQSGARKTRAFASLLTLGSALPIFGLMGLFLVHQDPPKPDSSAEQPPPQVSMSVTPSLESVSSVESAPSQSVGPSEPTDPGSIRHGERGQRRLSRSGRR